MTVTMVTAAVVRVLMSICSKYYLKGLARSTLEVDTDWSVSSAEER